VRGSLSAERATAVRAHLADCDTCRILVADLAKVEPVAPATVPDDAARYVLGRLIATGGMGEVFAARDRVLGREVAIKLLREDADSPEALAQSRLQLEREARLLASLAHPNVVAIYDHGLLDGRAFLAMEFVQGRTLRRWLADESPTPSRIFEVLQQAGRGLCAAHAIGIIHRDFKPDNVLVGEDGRTRVVDFGLARPVLHAEDAPGTHGDELRSGDGSAAGTPAYMAPEQRASAAVDARCDQYAFCVTLHEALHGERPPSVDASVRGERWWPRLDRVLARGLRRDPTERYPSLRALLAEIDRVRAGPTLVRRRVVFAGIAVLAVALWLALRSSAPSGGANQPAELHAACARDAECPLPLVCRYPAGNLCGAAARPGVCGWPVDGCDEKSPEACGCDGKTYANGCAAHRAGASTAHRGPCIPCAPSDPCPDVFAGSRRTPAFCHVVEQASTGTCWPRPADCAKDGASVCGWDHRAYPNACEARRSGTDVNERGSCVEAEAEPPAQAGTGAATLDAAIEPRSGDLTSDAPDAHGIDARPLIDLADWITRERLPIFSLLVSRDGVIVFELYTSSLSREHAHYVMGVTTALTSTLIGVAIDRHLLPSADARLSDVLPAAWFGSEQAMQRFRAVTVRDVLAMSALDAPVSPHDESPASEERFRGFITAGNRARFALQQRVLAAPGRGYQYTDITPQLATGIIAYAAKQSPLEFADATLLGPMRFHNHEWMHQDRAGIDNGAYGLRLRPIDMQKLGILYLQHGMWNHVQLISRDWVSRAFTPWLRRFDDSAEPDYGCYWEADDFTPRAEARPAGAAGRWLGHVVTGWKGQRIAVFTDHNLVVTLTGEIEPPEDEAALFSRMIESYVIPAIEGTRGTPARPDPALRDRLAAALARAHALAPVAMDQLEPRMVPSIAPKEKHRPFRPD
jgi:CubicO group peptidase (beta-lactamase class C family)/predicted Ser/Thr protein kinase